MRRQIFTFFAFLFTVALFGQATLTGKVVDGESNESLIGASILLQGTPIGTVTDFDGSFEIKNVPFGEYTMLLSYTGFASTEKEISINGDTDLGTMMLKFDVIGLNEVNVFASVAIDRKTPIAVSKIGTDYIEQRLGNQEFTEIMKHTPSVTATKNSSSGGNSGGYGDGSIVVRGFAQEDVALLLNGIPVNGMEDNKIYWSNWAGLGDVTRSIQIQRGLGASKLSVASVGGTINIITKTTDQEKGGSFSYGMGNNGYQKIGLTLSTGRLDNGFAFTFSGSRTTADGYIENGYLDAWNYFFSVAKEFGTDKILTLTGVGSPQRHGQRDFAPSIGVQRNKFGTRYNDDTGFYQGEKYNMRDNFYHKPQVGLNFVWDVSPRTSWTTSTYLSIGRGGGTGDIGGFIRDDGRYREREFRQARDHNGHNQFDEYANYNRGLENRLYGVSLGALNFEDDNGNSGSGQIAVNRVNGLIKRASMNEHQWYGVLSSINHELTDNLTFYGGIDIRYYTGSHYRKTIDLLGAEYWFDRDNINNRNDWVDINGDGLRSSDELGLLIRPGNEQARKFFGSVDDDEKIDYHNDENINWYGAFGQVEYTNNTGLTAFLSTALNYTTMRRHDFFLKTIGSHVTDWTNFVGGNVKLGANYNINQNHNVFANFGLISRAPYFDALYPTFSNDQRNDDAKNESVTAIEFGYGYRARKLSANINYYYTKWDNKTEFDDFEADNGDILFLNLQGVDALHTGIEIDFDWKLLKNFDINAFSSISDWRWKNNPSASVSDASNNVVGSIDLFLDDLKVGNGAQTTFGLGAEYSIGRTVTFDIAYLHHEDLYASYNPDDRDDDGLVGVQPLKLPAYGITDFGLTWRFKVGTKDAYLRANVNNIFDIEYISWLNDSVRSGDGNINDDRDSAAYRAKVDGSRGWFGFGRTWNMTLKTKF